MRRRIEINEVTQDVDVDHLVLCPQAPMNLCGVRHSRTFAIVFFDTAGMEYVHEPMYFSQVLLDKISPAFICWN